MGVISGKVSDLTSLKNRFYKYLYCVLSNKIRQTSEQFQCKLTSSCILQFL